MKKIESKLEIYEDLSPKLLLQDDETGLGLKLSFAENDNPEVVPQIKLPLTVVHPASITRKIWNTLVACLLIYTATIMPYEIAFIDSYPYDRWFILGLVVDGLFFLDILMTCITAYYNSEYKLVTSNSSIFLNYFKKWLFLDLIACFPFELIDTNKGSDYSSSESGDYSSMAKLVRLPRLYRLFRISRVLKIFKNKGKSKFLDKIQDFLSIRHSVMRMCESVITITLCLHIATCMWYFTAKLESFQPDTWVTREGYVDSDSGTLYLTSLYWAITTLCTVGYGDISARTNLEKFLAICWMLFGLFFFSLTISNISSMMSSIDSK